MLTRIRKWLCRALVVLLALIPFSGCGPASQQGGSQPVASGGAPTAAETKIEGTTIRFANTYKQDENTTAWLNSLLAEYKERSGVTVVSEQFDNSDFRTWITTQHAAGSAPDIFDMNYNWAWEDFTKGYVVDLAPYLDAPNPYYENKILRDTLSPLLMNQAKSPDTGIYSVLPSRVSGVKIVYNRDMFADAGITEEPFTLNEFFEACEKLRAAGYVPFAFANAKVNDAHMNWWMHNFVSQMDMDLRTQMDLDGNGFVPKNELVAATDKGLIDFTQSPFVDGFNLLREFSQYWNSDFNSTDRTTSIEMFVSKRVAMTNLLSGEKNMIDQYENLDVNYGLMMMPAVTDENYPGASGKPLNNGGRIVDGYVITKNSDPAKQAAAADFMCYMLSPGPLTTLMDEFSALPPLVDLPLSEQAQGWLTSEKESILYANYFGYATSKEFTDFQVLSSQIFLTDNSITAEQYAEELNVEWKNMAEAAKLENNWTEANGYGTK